MDVTRKARRSDSLYYGEVSRRELCDIVANVEYENKELLKRVARLFDKTLELEAQKTKLRELVRHMYECMCNVDADGNHECYSCEYENEDGECDFERLMRELGIEVDR